MEELYMYIYITVEFVIGRQTSRIDHSRQERRLRCIVFRSFVSVLLCIYALACIMGRVNN